jgi:6-phosphogluconolactonase
LQQQIDNRDNTLMKRKTFLGVPRAVRFGIALLSAVAGHASAATWVYVSNADSQEISVLELDRAQGVLKPVQALRSCRWP